MNSAQHTEKLSEIADLNPSLAESLSSDEPVSFVPMSAVTAETASTSHGENRCYGEVSKGYTPFRDGDLLVAKITPCFENGKIAQATLTHRFGFGSTEFHVIRPKPGKADARYLLHFLRQDRIRRDGERKMTGSAGQRRVPGHFLAGLSVPLPPLPEQRRIAEILDKADALRAKRRAALAQLDTLTQSIFLDMFGDPATNPKGWSTCRLGSLVEINPRASSTGYGLKADERVSFVPMAAVSESERRIVRYEARAVSEVAKGYTSFKRGDVLVAKITPCFENGKACMTTDMPTEYGYGSTEFHVFRAQDELLASFVLHLLCLRPVRAGGERAMTGAAGQKRVPANYFADMLVPHPSRAVLAAFGQVLKLVGQIERHLQAERGRLDELFVSLQHRAFRSEL